MHKCACTYMYLCITRHPWVYACTFPCKDLCIHNMHECVYWCIYVCMYVCKHVCICVCKYECIYTECLYVFFSYAWAFIYVYILQCTVYPFVHIYIYIYIYIYTCMCACMHIWITMHVHLYILKCTKSTSMSLIWLPHGIYGPHSYCGTGANRPSIVAYVCQKTCIGQQ